MEVLRAVGLNTGGCFSGGLAFALVGGLSSPGVADRVRGSEGGGPHYLPIAGARRAVRRY